jgi:hypothetical protein
LEKGNKNKFLIIRFIFVFKDESNENNLKEKILWSFLEFGI